MVELILVPQFTLNCKDVLVDGEALPALLRPAILQPAAQGSDSALRLQEKLANSTEPKGVAYYLQGKWARQHAQDTSKAHPVAQL